MNMHLRLLQSLHAIEAIKTGYFTLKSGQTSQVYVDMRRAFAFPDIMNQIADAIWNKVGTRPFDFVCGVPYGAAPYATIVSSRHAKPLLMMRKQAKTYGTKQQIEGVYISGQSCLLIEDVITTGESLLEAIEQLRASGLSVFDVLTLVDREAGAREKLKEANVDVYSLFTLSELIEMRKDVRSQSKTIPVI